MAGHSKWANIKHRKAGADKKRGLMFSKCAKELMVSSRLGGMDPASNNRLRIAIAKARAVNMPRDTIERSIKKGAGELGSQNYEEFLYEVYAAGGIGMLVEGLTDKLSRTTPEIKSILNKANAALAESNAVKRLFHYQGYIAIDKGALDEENLMELVLDAGADDLRTDSEQYEIYTPIETYAQVSEALSDREIEFIESGLRFMPMEGTDVTVVDADQARKILALIDKLEEHEDVQSVYTNMTIPDDILANLE
ncbi:MAG: YebC/PmpR family DNA-binding transcriptional regulator [Leptospiraceae bacterium]|nr:YebC/PmpR family DNA-binding transcriptional regulator [Leptospiraceae bacterium]